MVRKEMIHAAPILVKECDDHIQDSSGASSTLGIIQDSDSSKNIIIEDEEDKIKTISEIIPSFVSNDINSIDDIQETDQTLESEKHTHEEKAHRRNELLKLALQNASIETSWTKGLFQTACIIMVGVGSTVPLTFFPATDLIQYPEYWYEIILHGAISITWFWAYLCYTVSYFLNIDHIKKTSNILFLIFTANLGQIFLIIASYYVWTKVCNYNFPIPFLGMTLLMFFNYLFYLVTWCRLPRTWRQKKHFRKRMRFLILIVVGLLISMMTWNMIILSLRKTQYQPFIASLMPLSREIFLWMFSKLVAKTASGDVTGAQSIFAYMFTANYSVLVCTILGFLATETTAWVLLGLDFSMNVGNCVRILWIKKRRPDHWEDVIELIQELVVLELLEFYTPLSFLLVTALAYYGPNGHLILNISSSQWTFVAIQDIEKTLGDMAMFIFVDLASISVTAMIFWIFCKINLFKLFQILQREFFIIFCVIQGYTLSSYLNQNLISWGSDYGFEFAWIYKENENGSENITNIN